MSDKWLVSIRLHNGQQRHVWTAHPADVNEYPNVIAEAEELYLASGGKKDEIHSIRVDATPDPVVYIVTQSSWIDSVHSTAESAWNATLPGARRSVAVRVVNETEPTDRQRSAQEELHLKRIKWGLEAKQ